MPKGNTDQPGAFVAAIGPDHFEGLTENGKRLATVAKNAKKRRIDLLHRKHRENKRAMKLAAKLPRCNPRHPCLSPSCTSCHQAGQEAFVAIVKAFSQQHLADRQALVIQAKGKGKLAPRASKLAAVTIVTGNQASSVGHLGTRSPAQVHRWFTDKLAEARVRMAIGVIEVTLIEHEEGRYDTQWISHIHGIIETRNRRALAKRLLEVFPASDMVPRPNTVVPWDGSSKWLRYCYKSKPRVRVGTDNLERFNVRTGANRVCRGTTYRALNDEEFLEYLLFMDSTGLGDRITTIGAQLRSSSQGCKLVKMHRPTRQTQAKIRDAKHREKASLASEKASKYLPGDDSG